MFEITKKCPHCDTALEFMSDGQCVVFIAHDEASCILVTRERVHMLEQAMLSQCEAYERRFADYRRQIDEMLTRNGLPTLTEQSERHEARARMMMRDCGMPVVLDT